MQTFFFDALPKLQVTNGKFDENGNAIVPKPTTAVTPSQGKVRTKRNKGDRNINCWTVPQRSGIEDNIDQWLAFIENTDTTKKTNIINVNKNNLSVTERSKREKKPAGNNKKEGNQLKKSTSMEELKSSSKLEEEIAQSERAQASLRQKQLQQQQHNAQKRNSTSDSKELNAKQSSNQAQANKRGERRSWGTEELADFEAIDDRDAKKHKETVKSMVKASNRKIEQVASTNASIESIPTNIEAAEFHVVTKKKKTKKRQIIEEAKAKQQQMHQRHDQGGGHMHGRHTNSNAPMAHKYQPSSTYTNDRDIYVNSLMAKENRRKSTSSVPPSDKSDSSDLDSVHSLPTTSTSIISYAEIARKANQQQEKLGNVNQWPAVSHNGKISESPENSNTSTSSSTVSSKSHTSNRSYDTVKASSPSEERTPVNADESRMHETPKAQPPPPMSDYMKNQLQKSKSCDSEKYTTTMSLDQFPGLEKTVKPQKSHPNFASVLTSPPPLQAQQSATSTASTMTHDHKLAKVQTAKKSIATVEANHPKENAMKLQKSPDEKVETNKATAASAAAAAAAIADVNHSKLVFVQNSAKAEEIANSDSSNLFVSITVKKTKKSPHNSNSMPANVSSKGSNGSQRTVRVRLKLI